MGRQVVSAGEFHRLAQAEEMLMAYERRFGSRPDSTKELERAFVAGDLVDMPRDGEGRVIPSEQATATVGEAYVVSEENG
jgi:hypothetical protein